MNNNLNLNNQSNSNPLLQLGVAALGLYALNKLISAPHDTVNYTLWYRNRLVYHGICYADRMKARLNEHELRGIIYDEYDYDHAKPRERAAILEKKLIRRDRPKYNYQHNY
ncbi:hypothetical protein SNE26_23930 [Mucilaginibacter sp. cycad4]|uniref:hypothetical protein n=1 Tax=Mucilaginibacter sp. cycad4 TaxID=3342096 RepID=UPI002AABCE17|nr:hypothetical protein [Mucilaginibacter gossypii]WPU99066.1 hypothetical protein SNE26_23930 [Mucilaginibacter gossypii]